MSAASLNKGRDAEQSLGEDEASWAALQARVGYEFGRVELLVRALTHRSFVNEATQGKDAVEAVEVSGDNQRLEFLGDAVLGVIVSHELFHRDREVQEGALSTRQAQIVCEPTLADAARHLKLGTYLRLGRGEHDSGGRDKDSLLADSFEALLAAVYLDGGLDAAHGVVVAHLGDALADVRQGAAPEDYKSRLQTLIQRDKAVQPEYRIISESGPAHAREFVAEVFVETLSIGSGTGRSKKVAEQQAAQRALTLLEAAGSAEDQDTTSELD